MGGSLNEAERPPQSPVEARQAQPVTLSVVIDGRLDAGRARQVAILADRLGLAGTWLRYPWQPAHGTGPGGAEPAGLLAALTSGARVPLGLLVDADAADPAAADGAWLDRLVQETDSRSTGRPAGLRIALAGSPPGIARWQEWWHEWWHGRTGQRPGGAVQFAVPRLAPPAGDGAGPADDGTGAAVFVPCAPGRDLAGEVSAAAAAAAGRAVLAEVTVSVGRTAAEARARADADELFTQPGHPAEQGLFGTLEECQAAAARLAQAGATELVCHLPLASDLPDVLAQLRSIAIGAGVLRPGEPPSAAPPPPAGWGGRRFTA
jgi:hypothetical protein